jgi:hypothetical protein
MYQMVIKIPNCHKTYQHFPIERPPKFTQIGILGSNRLATLDENRATYVSMYVHTYMHVNSQSKRNWSLLLLSLWRVTRLGDLLPIVRCLHWVIFLKITELASNLGLLFPHVNRYASILTKNRLGDYFNKLIWSP